MKPFTTMQTISPGYNYYLYGVDAGFLPVMDIQLVAGKNFSTVTTDNRDKVLVNEEATRLLGFASPEAALGQRIRIIPGNEHFVTVTGVLKNYHQQSLKETNGCKILLTGLRSTGGFSC